MYCSLAYCKCCRRIKSWFMCIKTGICYVQYCSNFNTEVQEAAAGYILTKFKVRRGVIATAVLSLTVDASLWSSVWRKHAIGQFYFECDLSLWLVFVLINVVLQWSFWEHSDSMRWLVNAASNQLHWWWYARMPLILLACDVKKKKKTCLWIQTKMKD